MKRERLNTSEVEQNSSSLYTLVNDMLFNRKSGLEKINEMFGTNITVEFSEPWKVEEVDTDEEQETLNESEQSIENISRVDVANSNNEIDVDVPRETTEEQTEEDVPRETTEEEKEDEV